VSPARPARPQAARSPAPWLSSVAARIQRLEALDEGWDGYGSDPVNPDFARAVLRFLANEVWAITPRPEVTPTSEGGLSVSWQRTETTFELEFSPAGTVEVYVFDRRSSTEWEGDIRSLPDGIDKWAWRVATG
jgi:hypothetical protein